MPDPKDNADPKPNESVIKVLEDLKSKLENPPDPKSRQDPVAPTEVVDRVNKTSETVAWMQLEKTHDDVADVKTIMEEELKIYPPERKTPEILEKVYWMAVGKKAKEAAAKKAPPSSQPAGGSGRPVVKTQISEGYKPNEAGTGGEGPGSGSEEEQLSDLEKYVADKLNVDHKSYAKSREAGRSIRSLEIPSDFKPTTTADIELRRMRGR